LPTIGLCVLSPIWRMVSAALKFPDILNELTVHDFFKISGPRRQNESYRGRYSLSPCG
jgi:hypothetical protein